MPLGLLVGPALRCAALRSDAERLCVSVTLCVCAPYEPYELPATDPLRSSNSNNANVVHAQTDRRCPKDGALLEHTRICLTVLGVPSEPLVDPFDLRAYAGPRSLSHATASEQLPRSRASSPLRACLDCRCSVCKHTQHHHHHHPGAAACVVDISCEQHRRLNNAAAAAATHEPLSVSGGTGCCVPAPPLPRQRARTAHEHSSRA